MNTTFKAISLAIAATIAAVGPTVKIEPSMVASIIEHVRAAGAHEEPAVLASFADWALVQSDSREIDHEVDALVRDIDRKLKARRLETPPNAAEVPA